jgi:N-acetylmuramoyl-L-alanine amidase
VDGPLALTVAYPPENAALAARDSNFIFGSTGSGAAVLTINGTAVDVAPNGAFLAFVPIPADGVYRLRATKGAEVADATRTVRVPSAPGAPSGPALLAASVYPAGALALPAGEAFEVGFRGEAGGRAYLVTPFGERLPLFEQMATLGSASSAEDFRTQTAGAGQGPGRISTYSRMVLAREPWTSADTSTARPRIQGPSGFVGAAASAAAGGAEASARTHAVFELVVGRDTGRAPVPLNLAVLTPGLPRVGEAWPGGNAPPSADWTVRGRPATSGPFHYFWPAGTLLPIDAERNGMLRVRLSGFLAAWVPAGDVRLLPEGTALPRGTVGGARFTPRAESVDLRVPLSKRMPFHVEESERGLTLDIYGATSAINFFQYGGLDPLIEIAEWEQPAEHVLRFNVRLTSPVWGYETLYDNAGGLVLRIRRPPPIDPDRPLSGQVILVDPGHGGPDSATVGPTRLTEADANLGIALKLKPMLEGAGARVVMTRTSRAGPDLAARPRMARDSNVHALVSIHNNAFPDGVNPFENNGTSVYYYHPHSADMAKLLQRELLAELGLRDIGYGRADLALARPTWLPAVLTETMFMMIPEHEAALRDPGVQERIARAHLRALESFFRQRAQASVNPPR